MFVCVCFMWVESREFGWERVVGLLWYGFCGWGVWAGLSCDWGVVNTILFADCDICAFFSLQTLISDFKSV